MIFSYLPAIKIVLSLISSKRILIRYVAAVSAILWIVSCGGNREDLPLAIDQRDRLKLEELASGTLDLTGLQLSDAYCSTCHLKPDPELLDKKTWEKSVLPDMRKRMGLRLDTDSEVSLNPQIYPTSSYISETDWKKIETYYVEMAPEEPIPQGNIPEIRRGIPGFELEIPDLKLQGSPLTTLLRNDGLRGRLFMGDRLGRLLILNPKNFDLLDSVNLDSPPSEIRFQEDGSIDLLTMGIMDPSTKAIGEWNQYPSENPKSPILKIENLNRPVHFTFGDLNQNGKEDLVISNFGNHQGNLSWYENTGKGYRQHILRNFPGGRRTFIQDMNGDGLPDIVALMAQAYEGVYIFYNMGNGDFREEAVLQFHPLFGCSDFDLVDFNGDGHLDILLTNGDNADLSPIFKNYHGVRIFINDGQNNFKEIWFFPMFGASKAIAGDFGGNGKLDIAAISFFPDWDQMPRRDFLYFQNDGALNFTPYALEQPLKSRWLILEKADLSDNGREDLLLGSLMFQQSPSSVNTEPWVPFVILRNQNR